MKLSILGLLQRPLDFTEPVMVGGAEISRKGWGLHLTLSSGPPRWETGPDCQVLRNLEPTWKLPSCKCCGAEKAEGGQ